MIATRIARIARIACQVVSPTGLAGSALRTPFTRLEQPEMTHLSSPAVSRSYRVGTADVRPDNPQGTARQPCHPCYRAVARAVPCEPGRGGPKTPRKTRSAPPLV